MKRSFMSYTILLIIAFLNLDDVTFWHIVDLLLRRIWIILSGNINQHLGYSGRLFSLSKIRNAHAQSLCSLHFSFFFSSHIYFPFVFVFSKCTCISEAVVNPVRQGERLQEEQWGQDYESMMIPTRWQRSKDGDLL